MPNDARIDAAGMQLVNEVARDLVAQLAPGELPLFPATSQAYFATGARKAGKKSRDDEMLGFGASDAVVFLTPFVLEMTKHVYQFLAGEVSSAAREQGKIVIASFVKKMFRKYAERDREENQAITLTSDQIAKVRDLALNRARQLGMPEDKASLLADSLAGTLSTHA